MADSSSRMIAPSLLMENLQMVSVSSVLPFPLLPSSLPTHTRTASCACPSPSPFSALGSRALLRFASLCRNGAWGFSLSSVVVELQWRRRLSQRWSGGRVTRVYYRWSKLECDWERNDSDVLCAAPGAATVFISTCRVPLCRGSDIVDDASYRRPTRGEFRVWAAELPLTIRDNSIGAVDCRNRLCTLQSRRSQDAECSCHPAARA